MPQQKANINLQMIMSEVFSAQTTEDMILKLMSALGSVVSYVREDEQLQLSLTVSYEDLSVAHLRSDASQGMRCCVVSHIFCDGWCVRVDAECERVSQGDRPGDTGASHARTSLQDCGA